MIEYVQGMSAVFTVHANEGNAESMSQYMRNLFPFFGLKSPLRKALAKTYIAHNGLPSTADLTDILAACWQENEREMQYFALDLLDRRIKKVDIGFINIMESCIVNKSWWDSVDWLATKHIGAHFARFPELVIPRTEAWMASGNFWLQRTAILFQLKYKNKTNKDLLFKYILEVSESKEFFLQKASGWALREYSKTEPETVRSFIASHPLPPLTAREGLKWLNK
jgi:3-methyladenine DNA glycosylase AlkD